MSTSILSTKLFVPPLRSNTVPRPRLIERLSEGLHGKLTLISASAGYGKTTLLSEWLSDCKHPVAWVSLDHGDSDPVRLLTYLVSAIQTIYPKLGQGVLGTLQSPQPTPIATLLTTLLNEIAPIPRSFILVLDDYHLLDTLPGEDPLVFLIEHLPPQMHLVISTREDPPLPLARLRARGEMTELRAADLRFTPSEAAQFLNRSMGLNISSENVAALESRTEGWIAGLQLAAISMQRREDTSGFIESFTGSHRFVLDYLVEEVLHQQPESVQLFLLRTSILDRLCAPLCDALVLNPSTPGQETLAYLEHANLFIVPLDNDRRWYRYHHLFADLLRQRLNQSFTSATEDQTSGVAELHKRASEWHEANGMEIYAFHHAAAANDIARAARLIEGENGMPLHFRGAVAPVLNWLDSLPTFELNARPSLWVMYASALSIAGKNLGVEDKLLAAEAALAHHEHDEVTRDLLGQIAAIRAKLAAPLYEVETVIAHSRRALELLHPDNLSTRTSANWTLGFAYQLQGERAAARQFYTDAISISRASGNIYIEILATTCLGIIQESENRLHEAAQSYRRVLELVGDPPWPTACEAYLGLARVLYEWNDLAAAQQHGEQSLRLARQIENIDSYVGSEVFLARVRLAKGDLSGATATLAKAEHSARQQNFVQQLPEIAAVQVLTMLHQGKIATAARLAGTHEHSISQARVQLAQGDPSTALAALEPLRQQAETKDWADQRLKTMILQALAHHARHEKEQAVHLLRDALALAESGGFIRIFIDEGLPMAELLSEIVVQGIMPEYIGTLLTAYNDDNHAHGDGPDTPSPTPTAPGLTETLSRREFEILQLIAQGLSNRAISDRLYLALSTVKGHNRNIFGKLHVQSRTEAVARARTLGLL